MNTKIFFSAILFPVLLLLLSCSNDNDDSSSGSRARDTFQAMYPNASNISWESKYSFHIVEFRNYGQEMEAWYGSKGTWFLTETELRYSQLPESIKTAFLGGQYGTYEVDDISKIERPQMETRYVIEIDRTDKDLMLHYSSEGVLLSAAKSSGSHDRDIYNLIKGNITTGAANAVLKLYPGSIIVDCLYDNYFWDIDILDGGYRRELRFDNDYNWLKTTTEIDKISMEITRFLSAAGYSGSVINSMILYNTPGGYYYIIGLEQNGNEAIIKLNANGTVEVI